MGLFGSKNKKNDDIRVFNESDIQKKLYGDFPVDIPATSRYRAPEKRVESKSRLTVQEPKSANGDLFSTTNSSSYTTASSNQTTGDKRVESYIQQENKVVGDYRDPAYRSDALRSGQGTHPKPKKKRDFLKPFKAIGKVLWSVVQGVLALVVGVALFFDFRKPAFRKFMYLLVGVLFIAALFFGIHFLNVRREQAMKNNQSNQRGTVRSSDSKVSEQIKSNQVSKQGATSTVAPAASITSQVSVADVSNSTDRQVVNSSPLQALSASSEANDSAGETKFHVIQVATYAGTNDAESMAQSLRDAGFKAFVKVLSRPNGKKYFCVFLGRFSDYSEAEENLASFKKTESAKPFQDAFVRKLS